MSTKLPIHNTGERSEPEKNYDNKIKTTIGPPLIRLKHPYKTPPLTNLRGVRTPAPPPPSGSAHVLCMYLQRLSTFKLLKNMPFFYILYILIKKILKVLYWGRNLQGRTGKGPKPLGAKPEKGRNLWHSFR